MYFEISQKDNQKIRMVHVFFFLKWSIAPASASNDAHSDLLRSLNIQSITIMDQLRLRHVSTNGIVKATSEYLF
jgi:hypothetical protein